MNQLQIVAAIAERETLRYTPAGIPVVCGVLTHSSQQTEAGMMRLTEFELTAMAAGEISGRFNDAKLGVIYRFTGFLARKSKNSRTLVFHLSDFEEPHLDTGAQHGIR